MLKTLYTRSYVKLLAVGHPQSHVSLMWLQSVLDGWRELPQAVGIRTLAKAASQVGGQGLVHCACKGPCDKNSCSCFKAERKCNSRCHKGQKVQEPRLNRINRTLSMLHSMVDTLLQRCAMSVITQLEGRRRAGEHRRADGQVSGRADW